MGRGARHTRQKQRGPRGAEQVSLAERSQRAARHGPRGPYVPPPPRGPYAPPPAARRRAWRPPPGVVRVFGARCAAAGLTLAGISGLLAQFFPLESEARTLLSVAFAPALLLCIVALLVAAASRYEGGAPGVRRRDPAGPGTLAVQLRARDDPMMLGFAVMLMSVLPVAIAAALLADAFGVRDLSWAPHAALLVGVGTAWAAKRARDAGCELVLADDHVVAPVGWGVRRVVRYDKVAGLVPEERALRMQLHGGGSVVVDWHGLSPSECAGLVRELSARCGARGAVREAAAVCAGEDVAVPDVASARYALLDRAGRSLSAWRAAVESLLAPARGYRHVAMSREDVLRVLVDPATPAERRIAAAMALSRDADGAARVRAAAEAAGEKRVRVALERVLEDALDERVVERAVEAEQRATRG